jgi:hypothetical protein
VIHLISYDGERYHQKRRSMLKSPRTVQREGCFPDVQVVCPDPIRGVLR